MYGTCWKPSLAPFQILYFLEAQQGLCESISRLAADTQSADPSYGALVNSSGSILVKLLLMNSQ